MQSFQMTFNGALIVVALSALVLALSAVVYDLLRRGRASQGVGVGRDCAVFLFDDRFLVDATPAARQLISGRPAGQDTWNRLMSHLSADFPGIQDRIETLKHGEKLDLWSATGAPAAARLTVDWVRGLMRLQITEAREAESPLTLDSQTVFEMERDVALLRTISQSAPILIWRTRGDTGEVIWANQSYLDAAKVATGATTTAWPPPRLGTNPATAFDSSGRAQMGFEGSSVLGWYDVSSHPTNVDTTHYAIPADAAVLAEGARRDFVQTLAKTFAHLPIGLTIFNSDRRLILFNPALTDLSRLPVDLLSGRPSLSSFLDELRNRNVMPEPKNYATWRQTLTELEASAEDGTYEETWSLPDGLIYKVTGQPHPGGAIALLFEDITHEISVTRRFRMDMELGQSVLDNIPEAMAVFSDTGTLVLSNTAFGDLWGVDPRGTLGDINITDCMKIWIGAAQSSPIWGDARDFVLQPTERAEWTATATLLDGRKLSCRFTPMPGRATLIGFSVTEDMPAAPRGRAKKQAAMAQLV